MKLLEISFGNWNNILHGSCVTTFIIRDFAKQSQLRITAHILLYALSVFIKGAQNKMQTHSLSFSHKWLKIFADWNLLNYLAYLNYLRQLIPCILFLQGHLSRKQTVVIFDARLAEFAMASFCNVPEANVCLKIMLFFRS